MNKLDAWKKFQESGKVEDYIEYKECSDEEDYDDEQSFLILMFKYKIQTFLKIFSKIYIGSEIWNVYKR